MRWIVISDLVTICFYLAARLIAMEINNEY